jgi:hypothetical protein
MKIKTTLLSLLAALYLFLDITSAQAVKPQPSPFRVCLKRTQNERANCQSGCGMILKSCYDEAIVAIDAKTNAVQTLLTQKYVPLCAKVAKKYIESALQLASQTVNDAQSQPGWLSAELSLHFAQQRLETLELIQKQCK